MGGVAKLVLQLFIVFFIGLFFIFLVAAIFCKKMYLIGALATFLVVICLLLAYWFVGKRSKVSFGCETVIPITERSTELSVSETVRLE